MQLYSHFTASMIYLCFHLIKTDFLGLQKTLVKQWQRPEIWETSWKPEFEIQDRKNFYL